MTYDLKCAKFQNKELHNIFCNLFKYYLSSTPSVQSYKMTNTEYHIVGYSIVPVPARINDTIDRFHTANHFTKKRTFSVELYYTINVQRTINCRLINGTLINVQLRTHHSWDSCNLDSFTT